MTIVVIGEEDVRRHLTFRRCIPLIAEAMIALSRGETRQLLRGIIDLDGGRCFGVMPGAMSTKGPFGDKIVSVFAGESRMHPQSHQGLITIFDPVSGAPAAIVHAGEVTRIRTAAASAVATNVLARTDARHLAVLGNGEQAQAHIAAIAEVRSLETVTVWARSEDRARAFAHRVGEELGLTIHVAATVQDAVKGADIICTTTASHEPVLLGHWVAPGCHINVVGSSRAGPSEVDTDLVVRSRFFADHRAGVLSQGAEFLYAKAAGLVDDGHVLGEIGSVLHGSLPGRLSGNDVTVYKSLGSIVQDLASAWYLYSLAQNGDIGTAVPF